MSRAKRHGAPDWTPFERAHAIPVPDSVIERTAAAHGQPLELVRAVFEERMQDELWKNSRYQVAIDRAPPVGEGWPAMIHLSIKRLDRAPIYDWRDMQRIKNELVGPNHEAVQLYPSEERVVDTANQYHLWVLAEPGIGFPFGWTTGLRSEAENGYNRQRPFDEPAKALP